MQIFNRRVVPFVPVVALCLVPQAYAQVLTSRTSSLNYNYVYGAGGDTHTGSELRQRVTLLASDSDTMNFIGSTAGSLPGGPYSAGVSNQLNYQYNVTGTLNEIQSISASASSVLAAATTGLGSAAMLAANPGNDIYLYFTVERSVAYHLTGTLVQPNTGLASSVTLQHFNGFNWEIVSYSAFLPIGQTTFDVSGMFIPGPYRINGNVGYTAGANQNLTAGYSFLLDVPGQGSCAADFNDDGIVDFFDYLDFVDAFSANLPVADFNSDGVIDFFDYLDFVDTFSTGC